MFSQNRTALLRSVLTLALASLLLAAFVVWFRANYEKKAVSVPVVDLSRKAPHAFSLSAAYLQQAGQPVQVRQGMRFFSDLPASGSILMLHSLPSDARGELWQRLYDWAQSGGHLILAPSAMPGKRETAFLARIGAELLADKSTACSQGQEPCPGEDKEAEPDSDTDEPVILLATVEGYRLRIDISAAPSRLRQHLPNKAVWRVEGMLERPGIAAEPGAPVPKLLAPAPGDWLQRYATGTGSITLLSSMQPFLGSALEQEDNAFFLSAIIRSISAASTVEKPRQLWLWLPGQSESLIKRLRRQYPLFLSSLAVALLVWILVQQARLGPPLAPRTSERRDVLAYFDGAGRFAWRVNRAAGLITANRDSLAHALQRRRTEQSGQAAREEQAALHAKVQSSQDLVRVSKAMQQMRQAMLRGKGRRRNIEINPRAKE